MAAKKSPAKLKVFRTPIGFHDAYVAAPSKKAALAAWGSTHDLFARGAAEIVTDPALTADALAQPGVVIKRSRGTTAEQIAALPAVERPARAPEAEEEPSPVKPRSARGAGAKSAPKPKAEPKPVVPRPTPEAVEAAEAAIEAAERCHADEARALDREQAALDRRRRDLDRAHSAERDTLRDEAERAGAAYEAALKRWRADRRGAAD